MRTLIFALILLASNAFAQPTPREWINPFTTNRPPQPVFGDNNIAISNRIAGAGGGTSWYFYGISPNTVARLTDSTNIARSIVSSSNGLYVLKFNGPSDGQTATNLTTVGNVGFGVAGNFYDPNANSFLAWDAASAGLIMGPDYGLIRVIPPQTNSSTLDVSDQFKAWGASHFYNGVAVDGDILVANDGLTVTAGGSDITGPLIYHQISAASKLAAFDALLTLTNSVFSDATISSLTNAVAGLTNLISATNKYILSNAGLGTNNTFFSATNTAQASNQVVSTFKGVTGQSNNLIEWGTNNASGNMIRQGVIAANGNVGIGTNAPSNVLSIGGGGSIEARGGSIFFGADNNEGVFNNNQATLASASSTGFQMRDSFAISGIGAAAHIWLKPANSGDSAAPMRIWFGGGSRSSSYSALAASNQPTLFTRTSTIPSISVISGSNTVCNLGVGITNPTALLDLSNYTAQVGMRFDGVSTLTNDLTQWWFGNTLIAEVKTNSFRVEGTIYAPTNTAPTKTIISGGLHVLTLGKGWTNDLGGRADLVMQVKFTDAATGDPSFAFTNTTSGVSWTNGIAFGLTANTTMNITEPDIDPNDTGSLTDLSGTGATVTILQAWWKVH